MRLAVDSHPEDADARAPCLGNGAAAVLDGEATFIMIDIIRLAIRQQQKQLAALRSFMQLGAGVADGGTDAGVEAGLQRRDATLDSVAHRFIEILHCLHSHPGAAA
ncbi:hypothetical protein D3C86_1389850 [compost metagenome]